jgi:4a-hydroxytetrahydrobiopterin dehydratase
LIKLKQYRYNFRLNDKKQFTKLQKYYRREIVMPKKLSQAEIHHHLAELNEKAGDKVWLIKEGKLHKTFTFKSFIRAFGWMTQIAIWAEKLKHHPEWFNVYNKVVIDLVTHDVDGISDLDFELATKMELFSV